MNISDMTTDELQEALTREKAAEKLAKARVKEILSEILNRRRDGLDDGYWTSFGFVKK